MADRVHGRTAVVRLAAEPALGPGLAQTDVHVIGIADGADGCPPLGANAADFAGRQGDLRPLALTGGKRRTATGTAGQLTAPAGLKLDVVDRHAQRDLPQWPRVTADRLNTLA